MVNRTGFKIIRILVTVILALLGITMLLPLIWMISSSFKIEGFIFDYPIEWFPNKKTFSFDNWIDLFSVKHYSVPRFYLNSTILVVGTIICRLFFGSLGAFGFSRYNFPGRDKLFLLYLATIMIPFEVLIIPQYIFLRNLRLVDTLLAVILLSSFDAYSVFLLRQYFLSIPRSLQDAAVIDGAKPFVIYSRIILPLARPAFASLAIITLVGVWNDYMKCLIFLNSPENFPIVIGVLIFHQHYNLRFGPIMAAATISVFPLLIIFLIFQKEFVRGFMTVGIKG